MVISNVFNLNIFYFIYFYVFNVGIYYTIAKMGTLGPQCCTNAKMETLRVHCPVLR